MWNWLDKWVLAGERLFLSFVWLFSPIYKKWKNLLKYFQFTWFLTCNFPFSHPGKKTFSWKNMFSLGFAHESLFFLCVYVFSPGEQKHEYFLKNKKIKNYQNPFLYSFSQKMSCRAGKKFPEMFISTGFHTSAFLFFLGSKKKKSWWNDFFLCGAKWKSFGRRKNNL